MGASFDMRGTPEALSGKALPLDSEGLHRALGTLGVGAAELWAVIGVETTGCGFLPDRRPKILFERHVFSRETSHVYDATQADISNRRSGGYGAAGAPQYERLERAMALDRRAALRSASWGIGQVMGYHAVDLGYPGVEEMVAAMTVSEAAQLEAAAAFMAKEGLNRALQTHDWPSFARGYNGPAYARDGYDTRLASCYQRYLHGGLPDLTVREAQIYLLYLGYSPGVVDGVMGRFTRSALNEFQEKAGIRTDIDGPEPDGRTMEALRRAAEGSHVDGD
jgi:hypothetical protein